MNPPYALYGSSFAPLRLLLHGGELLFPAPLGRLRASLGVKNIVPPPEAARVVADEELVVHVVVLGTGPERQEVV